METRLLTLYCKKCKARTKPFGDSLKIVPYSANVICPECGNEEWVDWLDTETLKKVLQNK